MQGPGDGDGKMAFACARTADQYGVALLGDESAGRRKDCLCFAEVAINLFEARQEARHSAWADGKVKTDFDIAAAEFAGSDPQALFGRRIFDPQEIVRQLFAKTAMDFANAIAGEDASRQAAGVDPSLNLDMRLGLALEIALVRVGAIVVLERALDIDGVSVVSFDEIAVVAVHRPDEMGERRQQAARQAAAKACGFLRELKRQVGQLGTMAGALLDNERLHQGDLFAPIFRRFDVRFDVRGSCSLYYIYIR